MKEILIDQDNTLADFDEGFSKIWQGDSSNSVHIPASARKSFYLRDDYPTELRQRIDEVIYAPGFIRNLPPISGAVDALKEIREEGYNVWIVTSPLSHYQNCVTEKYEWVEKHLGIDWIDRIILAKDKTFIRGDILIDDRPEIRGQMQPSWEYVLFDRPYNQEINQFRRLTSWQNWKEILH